MDLLYILSNGSKFNNDELKYSLRTVEKHFKGVDNIVIVGERPDFISDEIKYHYIKEAWEKSKSHYFGMVVKSTYCNWYGIKGELYEDAKIHELLTASDFERIYNTNCFSCSDLGWVHGIADYLEVMYPNPSKYEKVLETTI